MPNKHGYWSFNDPGYTDSLQEAIDFALNRIREENPNLNRIEIEQILIQKLEEIYPFSFNPPPKK